MRIIRFIQIAVVAATVVLFIGAPHVTNKTNKTNRFSGTWELGYARAESSQPTTAADHETLVSKTIKRWKSESLMLLSKLGVSSEVVKLYAKWVIGAPALVLFILILMLLRPRRKLTQLETKTPAAQPAAAISSANPSVTLSPNPSKNRSRPGESTTDTGHVLQFFLRLFKHQERLEPDAESEIRLIEHRNYCPHDTYEMQVAFKKDQVTRRMSMGLLGQGGGSRSRCFYVIYDSHLVIKIPTEPMTDFDLYTRQIAAEGRIVARLAPRLCIVPRVAVILSTIYAFDNDVVRGASSDEDLEAKYIRLLKAKPAYQEYLKIGGSFAFFMDLAKYFFLSTTLDEIHRDTGRLIDEVQAYPDLLWDHNSFVGRYGEDAGAVCNDLLDAYRECEIQLRQLIDETVVEKEVPSYLFKQWFLSHLAGEKIHEDRLDLRVDVIDNADKIIGVVLQSCQEQVSTYRKGIEDYKQGVRFSRHRRQLENLATNTLDLLAWIIEKGLALRDLKPENLFVAGNPDDYPIFLNDRSKFSIGLIDVETAVVMEGREPEDIPQPQLAGTPLYATPTHLLSNPVLYEIYNDVKTTLQMQDWHATIAILFKLFTGKNLFLNTAHVFPEIVNAVKILDPAGLDLDDQIMQISRLFWNSALAEFQDAMHDQKAVFNQVEVVVPAFLAPEIQYIMAMDVKQTETAMADLISEQSFFSSEEKISFLKNASAKKIGHMKKRLVEERDRGGRHDPHRREALIFFKHLERLKKDLRRKHTAMTALSSPHPAVAADQLLEAMFQRVFQHMYRYDWPPLTPSKYQGPAYMATDITTYQATL